MLFSNPMGALVPARVMAGTFEGSPCKQMPRPFRVGLSAATLRRDLNSFHQPPMSRATLLGPVKSMADIASSSGTSNLHTGLWKKDASRSDPMQEACDAVELNWVLRRAIGMLNYMEVTDGADSFGTTVKAGGVMDVVERYPKSGEEVIHSRRDKRSGTHCGKVIMTEEGPSIQVSWSEPYGGSCSDTFILSETGNEMTVATVMKMDSGQDVVYRTYYRRVRED